MELRHQSINKIVWLLFYKALLDLAIAESAAVLLWIEKGASTESAPKESRVLRAVAPLLDESPWKDWNSRRAGDGLDLIRRLMLGSCRSLNSYRMGLDALNASPVS